MINKGSTDSEVSVDDVSPEEKSKAFAVCWASYNKGNLDKGLRGKIGKDRKAQYKSLLKTKK